jgi:kynurenine formamidase
MGACWPAATGHGKRWIGRNWRRKNMRLVDLSRDIHHKMPRLLNHPSIVVAPYSTHDEIREADGYRFSTATLSLALGDHAGTHVDAPAHFDADPAARTIDQLPLEDFFLDAVCLDLSAKPLKSDISVDDLKRARDVAGVDIRRRDMVLLEMNFARRCTSADAFLNDFPGLTRDSATWLGKQGIAMFGVEAVSPGRPGRNNFEVHHVCRDLEFTHVEGLVNLDQVVGKGRFKFIGFPLKIRGGTASPIRAIAMLDE